jgi:ubiquinone/menaquinone biosynthesis C-methylase UbiE
MGLYSKYLLPRIIDLSMRNKEITRVRAECIPQARGEVLEVGLGSGLNLPFYSREVSHVFGVEPSAELQQMAQRRAANAPIKVKFLLQSAEEHLPLSDGAIDTVVITWTLCSIPDVAQALREVKRVLKRDGRLLFVEHGRAPDNSVAKWQDRLTPTWKRITGGCHLNRKMDDLITAAGFRISDLKTWYLPGPQPITFTYLGTAEHHLPAVSA